MKSFIAVFAVLLSVGVIPVHSQVKTSPAITASDLRDRISILASDSLDGRRSGSLGAEKAAKYISSEFRRIGLEPIDSDQTFLQHFSFNEHIDSVDTEHIVTANVLGLLRSHDPVTGMEVIVVGAHYDHLGHGGRYALDTNHDIHYGADDNASGTAGVIELAEYLVHHKKELKRSVLFIDFSGEEEGLYGSAYYTNHPLVPLSETVAMINMDMIGRLKPEDSSLIIEGIGTSPRWKEVLTNLNNPKQFNLHLKQGGMGPSDHESFYLKNLPVLFFFTGFHTDYHRSTDTWQKINYPGEVRVLEYVERLVDSLADNHRPIGFTAAQEDSTPKSTSFHVYVGGVPDYSYDGSGVKIAAVTEHSPAEKAGFKTDDVIVEFGGRQIKNIYDYTDALSKYKPGDVVQATLERGGVRINLPVTLGSRNASH